jgi:3-dehydroquinate dehydratase-2
MSSRIEVLNGVNMNMLGVRPAEHYGSLTLDALDHMLEDHASNLGIVLTTFQTNIEAEYVEQLHKSRDLTDGLILNPGAWTHTSWAIHDALEISGLPAVEVHLSDVTQREEWRQLSVIGDLCIRTISGKGPDGYVEALDFLAAKLGES